MVLRKYLLCVNMFHPTNEILKKKKLSAFSNKGKLIFIVSLSTCEYSFGSAAYFSWNPPTMCNCHRVPSTHCLCTTGVSIFYVVHKHTAHRWDIWLCISIWKSYYVAVYYKGLKVNKESNCLVAPRRARNRTFCFRKRITVREVSEFS